jgi:hypothetical protein
MQIVDLLFSPVVEKGTPIYLRLFISKYLDQFKKMYPNVRLIPKQQFYGALSKSDQKVYAVVPYTVCCSSLNCTKWWNYTKV